MKKQNGMNKLAFNKAAVVELNNDSLATINGGSSPACIVVAAEISSAGCAGLACAAWAYFMN